MGGTPHPPRFTTRWNSALLSVTAASPNFMRACDNEPRGLWRGGGVGPGYGRRGSGDIGDIGIGHIDMIS